jgi:hypothetical protein
MAEYKKLTKAIASSSKAGRSDQAPVRRGRLLTVAASAAGFRQRKPNGPAEVSAAHSVPT